MQQRQRETVSTHADGVTEGDRATVDVDDLVGDPEIVHRRDADSRERLVDLEEVDIADLLAAVPSAARIARLG